MKIHPPGSGSADFIIAKGREKYGWHWLRCDTGDWYGAKFHADCILQVRDLPPRFPTQQWRRCFGGDYIETGEWFPIDNFVANSGAARGRG